MNWLSSTVENIRGLLSIHRNATSSPLFTLMMIAGTGCDIHCYTPSALEIQSPNYPSAAFVIEGNNPRGIYANSDVDSAIYSYHTQANDENDFWLAVDHKSVKHDWTLIDTREPYRRYSRVSKKEGVVDFYSVEEVRIALAPATKNVVIAWVQCDFLADDFEESEDFHVGGSEADFANNYVWPQFEKEMGMPMGE